MDQITPPAQDAPTSFTRHALRFDGTAGEYFKIWIVNLALTIVTLGIFSAWAKVRSQRYFYGNTYLAGHSFDYHAEPLRILIGRAIAFVLLSGYTLTVRFAPPAAAVWALILVFAMPWLVKSSLRFAARNTSYRNIRFDFTGTYGGALKAFALWWMLAAVTLFTTLPLAHRARDYYIINNRRFGGKAFAAEIPGKTLYGIYGMALLLFIGAIILVVAVMAGVIGTMTTRPDPNNPVHSALSAGAFLVSYVAIFLLLSIYVGTRTFNTALNHTRLDGTLRFESTLSPWRMIWIGYSNLAAVLVSLGLLYPWARIRSARYRAEHIAMIGTPDMQQFTGAAAGSPNAIGEEVAGFFDIDMGL